MSEPSAAAADVRGAQFDAYAGNYDAALDRGISVSGEDKDYFARGRVSRTARLLGALGEPEPRRVMDFGCGTGSAAPFVFDRWPGVRELVGVDVSPASLEVARVEQGSERARFALLRDVVPDGSFDLVLCNGVFHHIAPSARADAVRYVFNALRPGGWFALWENNPWNPGTRYVMSRIPFDRDAVLLSPLEAQTMLRRGRFRVTRTDFQFIFPRRLAFLRPAEAALARLPLGAQYVVFARKPA